MNKIKILNLLFVLLFGAVVFTLPVKAEQPNQLTVSPATINVALSDANKKQITQILISNSYASNIDLIAELKGIDQVDGKLIPVGDIEPAFRKAITLSKTNITIPAKGDTILEVTINNTDALPAGGHYATLLLSQKIKSSQASVFTSQMSISIFAVKLGGERQNIDVSVLSVNRNIFTIPKVISILFTNTGNTYATPRAVVAITTSSNQPVANGVANIESQPLLPNKSLTSTAAITQTRFLWLPQKLNISTQYRIDGSETVKLQQSYFWYIPPVFVVLLISVSTATILTIRYLTRKKPTKKLNTTKRRVIHIPLFDIVQIEVPPLDYQTSKESSESSNEPADTNNLEKAPKTKSNKSKVSSAKKAPKPRKKTPKPKK